MVYPRESGLYHDMMRAIEKEGYTIEVKTKSGTTTVVNPKRKVAESALANAKSLASEFGLTSSCRHRVAALLSNDTPMDDFAEFEALM